MMECKRCEVTDLLALYNNWKPLSILFQEIFGKFQEQRYICIRLDLYLWNHFSTVELGALCKGQENTTLHTFLKSVFSKHNIEYSE